MNKHMAYLTAAAWANGGTLLGANLTAINWEGADLRYSYLRGAVFGSSLSRAELRRATLDGAIFRGDTLDKCIAAAERMDGYTFRLFRLKDGSHKVMAGCRWFTIPEYRTHVAAEYPGTVNARETLDILDFFQRRADA
jgi:hypothetical protein